MMRFFADGIVLFHVGFVLFVVFGGLLVLRWRPVMWAHVPAAAWGALLEFFDWICPLTPLENEFRRRAGQAGYEASSSITFYLCCIPSTETLTCGSRSGPWQSQSTS